MIAAKAIGGGAAAAAIVIGGVFMFGFLTRGPIVTELHPPLMSYSFSIVRSAPNWTLPISVSGLPAADAADAMGVQRRGVAVRFDPTLDPALVGGHRVVLRLAGARGRAQDACAAAVDAPEPTVGGTLYANAALCRGDRSLTAAVGELRKIEGPNDQRIPALLRQVAITLLPVD